MARFIPDLSEEDIPHDSERVVYRHLRDLDDEYVVMHSFPWLRPNRDLRDEPLGEGEADFVILHPSRGMLVLEVKGGHPELRGREWFRSGRPLKDPFEQAKRSRYVLLQAIEERTRGRVHRSMLTHGTAVIFPHVRYKGDLPLNTDERILIDALHIDEIPERIEAAYSAWKRRETRLSRPEFVAVLNALVPRLRLMRCVGAEIDSEHARIIRATQDQHAVLRGLLENRRVLVQGAAGSGKTLLAADFAATLAERGERVLLLCYNRALAAWLNDQVRRDPRFHAIERRLEISTFHGYALRVAHRAGVEFSVPSSGQDEFWRAEAALILDQALDLLSDGGIAPEFDAVIVDEGQDFLPDWWVTVESLTKDGPHGRLYVFMDLMQSLWGNEEPPPVEFQVRFPLTTNCRNTQVIAKSAGQVHGATVQVLPGSPIGVLPVMHRARQSQMKGLVLREVERLLGDRVSPRQIVLLGPKTKARSCLRAVEDIAGAKLVEDASDWRRGAGILVSTARSFKGLEADVVVLYDLEVFSDLFSKTDLYVAWTRAKHRLVVVCKEGGVRRCAEQALGAVSENVADSEI